MAAEKNVGTAVCWLCGTAGHETYRFCSIMRAFVCLSCETQKCSEYSAAMLPNGTHCRAIYMKEDERSRKLNRPFIAPLSDVNKARERYTRFNTERLYEDYCELLKKYDDSNDGHRRAELRIQLAAMQAEIKAKVS